MKFIPNPLFRDFRTQHDGVVRGQSTCRHKSPLYYYLVSG